MWICRSVAHLDSRNEGQLHPYESYSDGMQICQQKPRSCSPMDWIGLSPFDIARLQGNSVDAGSQNSDCSLGLRFVLDRRVAYDHTHHALALLLIFNDGDHRVFSGRRDATSSEHDARTRRLSVSPPPHFGMQPYDPNLLPCTGFRREVSPSCLETPRFSSTSDPRRRRVLRRSNLQFLTIGERLRILRSYPVSQTQGLPTVSSRSTIELGCSISGLLVRISL